MWSSIDLTTLLCSVCCACGCGRNVENFVCDLFLYITQDPNSAVYKALTFYKSCMNESEIETTGTKPMIAVLKKYGLWNITNQTQTLDDSWKLENILAHVFVELGTSAFISLDVGPNIFDTSSIIFSVS